MPNGQFPFPKLKCLQSICLQKQKIKNEYNCRFAVISQQKSTAQINEYQVLLGPYSVSSLLVDA